MTKRPRVRRPGMEHTVSATDEEWDDVRSGAANAGMSVSAWAVHCTLTADFSPGKHRRLVLEEKQQRSIARAVNELARSLIADVDAPSRFAHDFGAVLKARLETTVREGRGSEVETFLRQELGEERATLIATAVAANANATPASTPKPKEKKAPRRKKSRRDDDSGQGELF